jgi:hypothetical protein
LAFAGEASSTSTQSVFITIYNVLVINYGVIHIFSIRLPPVYIWKDILLPDIPILEPVLRYTQEVINIVPLTVNVSEPVFVPIAIFPV